VVTKSETDAVHGVGRKFLRNEKLDARNPFPSRRNPLRRSQFGGNIGGPVACPTTTEGSALFSSAVTKAAAYQDLGGDLSDIGPANDLVCLDEDEIRALMYHTTLSLRHAGASITESDGFLPDKAE